MAERIAIIHATRAAMEPAEVAFAEIWPAADHWSLLDEGLTQAVDRAGALSDEISARFIGLADYAAGTGVDAILFTCTAFGPAMEACRRRFPFPVLKPNEALLERAVEVGGRVGLLASHPATLPTLTRQLADQAAASGRDIEIVARLADGAWDALKAGRRAAHDDAIVAAAETLADCDSIALAQFSMAPLAARIGKAVRPIVFSSPHAAVEKLRRALRG